MADEKHLKILKKGVAAWNEWHKKNLENEWRKKNRAERLDLSGATLAGLNLVGAGLQFVDLSSADCRGANFEDADMEFGNFSGAKFEGASLISTHLSGANFDGANLIRVNLYGATLSGTNLRKAELSGASLIGALLNGADFSGSVLNQTDFSGSLMVGTVIVDVDLSGAVGLESVKHMGPSTIGVDTIYTAKGKIPESFLRGVGVPEPFVREMKALVNAMEPIQFYSCFLSYSSKDQEFAERLYADLQQKNVRCWFAPEDMKIGDKFRQRIDEAIRMYDKLLLVLTENSVKSAWVEKEVEAAFEKERKQGRPVLFPVRLDGAVMEAEEAWAADIRRTRHIGDFRDWKSHDSYRNAFERLMRDLKAS